MTLGMGGAPSRVQVTVKTAALVLLPLGLLSSGCSSESRAAPPVPSASVVPAITAAASAATAPPESAAPPIESARAIPAVATAVASVSVSVDAGTRDPTECPDGMAKVGRNYCIDKWEAHLVVKNAAGEISKLPFFARPPEDGAYEARCEEGALPQGYISRVEAARACKNAGKRLCSKGEWQRACEGKRGTHYPYGPKWQEGRCNMDKGHLLSQKFGADSRRWRYEQFNDPTLNQEPGFLVGAGAFPDCVSSYGVYDLVGNLHEWVSDTVDEDLMAKLDEEQVERKSQSWRVGNGVFMGGFFSTHEQLGPGCRYTTVAHEPTYHDYSTGFRCCASLPPAPKAKGKRPRN